MEETRRQRTRLHWVRVDFLVGLAPQDVQHELELLLHRSLPDCVFHRHSLVVKCASELEKYQLLQFHGGTIDGRHIKVRSAHFQISGDEILEFVREELLLLDEFERRGRTSGCFTAEKVNSPPKF